MERFRKLAGPPDSDGINSCPTVLEVVDNDEHLIVQGIKLDAATRRELNIPDGEDAVFLPKDIYLRGADKLTED